MTVLTLPAHRLNITLSSIKPSTMSESCSSCVPAEANAQDVFVAKLDENGEWLWATSGGGTAGDQPYAMELTSQGEAEHFGRNTCRSPLNVTFGDGSNQQRYVSLLQNSARRRLAVGESVRDL